MQSHRSPRRHQPPAARGNGGQAGDLQVLTFCIARERLCANDPDLLALRVPGNGAAMGDRGARDMARALRDNKTLTSLRLLSHEIRDRGAKALAAVLDENSTLTLLDLSFNPLGPAGTRALAGALRDNRALTQLRLSKNCLMGLEGVLALADMLRVNCTLRQLHLGDTEMGDESAAVLISALEHNSSLRRLNLSGCCLGSLSTRALAAMLTRNQTLLDLVISGNPLMSWSDPLLATGLGYNCTLRLLAMSHCDIGYNGAVAVASALTEDSALTHLDIGGNGIGPEGAAVLASALKQNRFLQQLRCSYNRMNDSGARALVEAAGQNSVLCELRLCSNNIGSAGASALADSLKATALQVLDLGWNPCGKRKRIRIQQILECNRQPTACPRPSNALGCDTHTKHRQLVAVTNRNPSAATNANVPTPLSHRPHQDRLRLLTPNQLKIGRSDPIRGNEMTSVFKGDLEGTPVSIQLLYGKHHGRYLEAVDAQASLRHPHLLRIYDKCVQAGALVVETTPGGSVQQSLQEDQLPWWDRVRILHEAAVGLQFLHNQERPIFHRDLRPSNILLGGDGKAKLADTGLAEYVDVASSDHRREEMLTGPVQYLCPGFLSSGIYGAAADIYSFGITSAVLVTGLPPHSLMRRLLEAMADDSLEALIDQRPGAQAWDLAVAKELLALALRCTRGDAAKRPSLQEVITALETLYHEEALPASRLAAKGCEEAKMELLRREVTCPLSLEVMTDPVQAADGFTYDRTAIEAHLATSGLSPMTNMQMSSRLTKNRVAAAVVGLLELS